MMEKGTGAVRDAYDIRDYKFKGLAGGGGFDWEKGYDIEKVLGKKIFTKDQGKSYSCGGQAWAYYGEVLEAIVTGSYEPRSARWIYSHTYSPYGGGSTGRDNSDHVVKKGWALEKDALSYEDGKVPTENFIRIKPVLTPEALAEAEKAKAFSYLNVAPDIDLMAQALVANYGLVIGVEGSDNGTWRSEFPKPPNTPSGVSEWRHWVYVGKARLHKGKKQLGIKNSWGNNTGKSGWQWIDEEYFTSGHVWHGWTLAWNYQPSQKEKLMKEVVRLAQLLIAKLKGQNANSK